MIIMIGHEKGGVGKSTTAITLAAFLASDPRRPKVVLVDADESRNAVRWGELRTENELPSSFTIVSQSVDTKTNVLKLAEVFDHVVVDVGAGDYIHLLEIANIADLWIAPTGVGQKDADSNVNIIEAVSKANHKHKRGRIPLVFAINKASSAANSSEAYLVQQALRDYSDAVVVLKSVICDRKVFRDADREGKTIFEMPNRASEKAVNEFVSMASEALKTYLAFTSKKGGS